MALCSWYYRWVHADCISGIVDNAKYAIFTQPVLPVRSRRIQNWHCVQKWHCVHNWHCVFRIIGIVCTIGIVWVAQMALCGLHNWHCLQNWHCVHNWHCGKYQLCNLRNPAGNTEDWVKMAYLDCSIQCHLCTSDLVLPEGLHRSHNCHFPQYHLCSTAYGFTQIAKMALCYHLDTKDLSEDR